MTTNDGAPPNLEQLQQVRHVGVIVSTIFMRMRVDDHAEIIAHVFQEVLASRIRCRLCVLVKACSFEYLPVGLKDPLKFVGLGELRHFDELAAQAEVLLAIVGRAKRPARRIVLDVGEEHDMDAGIATLATTASARTTIAPGTTIAASTTAASGASGARRRGLPATTAAREKNATKKSKSKNEMHSVIVAGCVHKENKGRISPLTRLRCCTSPMVLVRARTFTDGASLTRDRWRLSVSIFLDPRTHMCIGTAYLGPKSADRGNRRVCKGIRRTPWGREGMGGEGRCEGTHVRVWVRGQDTRDSAAVQDGCAEVVTGASFYVTRKIDHRSAVERFKAPRTPNLGPRSSARKILRPAEKPVSTILALVAARGRPSKKHRETSSEFVWRGERRGHRDDACSLAMRATPSPRPAFTAGPCSGWRLFEYRRRQRQTRGRYERGSKSLQQDEEARRCQVSPEATRYNASGHLPGSSIGTISIRR